MAGLFDSYYDQGNQGGGSLIERLLSQLQQQPQQNSFPGLPSDQAQYGAAPQYGSPMFATAQMMPQQQPAPQPMPQQPQSQPMPQPVQAQPPPQMPPQMQQPMQAAPQQPMVNGIPEAFLQPTGGVGGFFRGLSDSARNGSGLCSGPCLAALLGPTARGRVMSTIGSLTRSIRRFCRPVFRSRRHCSQPSIPNLRKPSCRRL